MINLPDVITTIRERLAQRFSTVRISALQTSDQLLAEIKAIHPDKLPGVIVVFDRLNFADGALTKDTELTLVLVDQFRAGSDEKALSLFQAAADLLELFPATGTNLGGIWCIPVDCTATGIDNVWATLAVGIKIRQQA